MRSFTKKNIEPFSELDQLLSGTDDNIKSLRELLDDEGDDTNPFFHAQQQVISLFSDPFRISNIDTEVLEKFRKLANLKSGDISVENFHLNCQTTKGTGTERQKLDALGLNTKVDGEVVAAAVAKDALDGELTEYLKKLKPSPIDIYDKLKAGGPYSIAPAIKDQTIKNISRLLVLRHLYQIAKIRFKYEDFSYEDNTAYDVRGTISKANNPITILNQGKPHGDSKPYLIQTSGLFCGFCESPLLDGGSTDVEHKIPKGYFQTMERIWSNFIIACKRCNSQLKGTHYTIKIDKKVPPNSARDTGKQNPPYPAHNFYKIGALEGKPKDPNVKNNMVAQLAEFITNPPPTTKPPLQNKIAQTAIMLRLNNDNERALSFAKENTLWPDVKNFDHISSKIVTYKLKKDGTNERDKNDYNSEVTVKISDLEDHAKINFKYDKDRTSFRLDLENPGQGTEENIRVTCELIDKSTSADTKRRTRSTQRILEICGLNYESTEKEGIKDNVVHRRTKAWLHAMKQLKIIHDFQSGFKELGEYYDEQLNPKNIKDAKSIKGGSAFTTIKTLRKEDGTDVVTDHDLKEWNEKRDALSKKLAIADQYVYNAIWDNIKSMVKDGGFYSTWIRTFQSKCKPTGTAEINKRVDIELVRILEIDAQSNPNDPFQFHGTDANEIIDALA